MANDTQIDLETEIKRRFLLLPKPVQNAIISADISKGLATLAGTHKLHVDQWQQLENEVMLTLLGIQQISTFTSDIQDAIGITAEEAATLAKDINSAVFEPIRKELQRELDHPAAEAKIVSDIEASRSQILGAQKAPPPSIIATTSPAIAVPAPALPKVMPATPPAAAPETKAVRAPISSSYTSQTASHERKSVEGDPYREQVV